jgi:hypothetical protein
MPLLNLGRDMIPFLDFSGKDRLGEGIFEKLLDSAAHRAGPVVWIVSFGYDEITCRSLENKLDLFFSKSAYQFCNLQINNLIEIIFLKHAEDHKFIESVQKLGAKMLLGDRIDLSLHPLIVSLVLSHRVKAKSRVTLDALSADVRGQDDDGIPEVDLATKTVGNHALLQDLEKEVHHIGVSLFNLVK